MALINALSQINFVSPCFDLNYERERERVTERALSSAKLCRRMVLFGSILVHSLLKVFVKCLEFFQKFFQLQFWIKYCAHSQMESSLLVSEIGAWNHRNPCFVEHLEGIVHIWWLFLFLSVLNLFVCELDLWVGVDAALYFVWANICHLIQFLGNSFHILLLELVDFLPFFRIGFKGLICHQSLFWWVAHQVHADLPDRVWPHTLRPQKREFIYDFGINSAHLQVPALKPAFSHEPAGRWMKWYELGLVVGLFHLISRTLEREEFFVFAVHIVLVNLVRKNYDLIVEAKFEDILDGLFGQHTPCWIIWVANNYDFYFYSLLLRLSVWLFQFRKRNLPVVSLI